MKESETTIRDQTQSGIFVGPSLWQGTANWKQLLAKKAKQVLRILNRLEIK